VLERLRFFLVAGRTCECPIDQSNFTNQFHRREHWN
jgi:hypothetical protein